MQQYCKRTLPVVLEYLATISCCNSFSNHLAPLITSLLVVWWWLLFVAEINIMLDDHTFGFPPSSSVSMHLCTAYIETLVMIKAFS